LTPLFELLKGLGVFRLCLRTYLRKTKEPGGPKRPDPIDGLGRVGKIQKFLEDLDQLLGSDLPGILLVL
jgi:hypothetical protein